MKTVVVVGLFILIACFHHSANGAAYLGKTDDCSKGPKGFENSCYRFLCDEKSGEYQIHTCGISTIECEEGQAPGHHPEDLTKPYPDCCAVPYCRDA